MPRFLRNSAVCLSALLALCLSSALHAAPAAQPTGLAAGQEDTGAWWMQVSALSREGKLDLKSKPWWPRAAALKVGESFMLEDAGGPVLVRREKLKRAKPADAIVIVIDDDNDGSLASGGDGDSDCYLADWAGDGVPDRMVDYIDNDADNDPDEMDIRYFVNGELRSVWCGEDLDDDSSMWDVADYEYTANFFRSDPHGNATIYMNKFDPSRGAWVPISECPFAFFDTDNDTYSEIAVRFSAVPLRYDASSDPDYANDAGRYRGAWSEDMARMGIVNVRYSFDMDRGSSKAHPLHYDMGFNLVGGIPYQAEGMEHTNARRRPPQTVVCVPHGKLIEVCDTYPARETGFSWHEHTDDTIAIGAEPTPQDDYRWEGVFWIWERRWMENTGGPNQKYNVRREYSRTPADKRELYVSGIDGRIHLKGASEGWLEIGHFAGLGRIGEVRMSDTDANGYFDRWAVYLGDDPRPVRVTTVRDEQARPLAWDREKLIALHTDELTPAGLKASTRLYEALVKAGSYSPPPALAKAFEQDSPARRWYARDVACELALHHLRTSVGHPAEATLRAVKLNDLRPMDAPARAKGRNSQTAWQTVRLLEQIELAYGNGRVDECIKLLDDLTAAQAATRPAN